MMITKCIDHSLSQLTHVIQLLSDDQYKQPLQVLTNASIGQHVRHIIEFLQVLEEAYYTGEVNYEKRKRDKEIENDKSAALKWLQSITNNVQKENRDLLLHVNCTPDTDHYFQVPTNYFRELLYNFEHIVHHMAIIRIGFSAFAAIDLPEGFGIAHSTIKYKNTCVQ